MRVGTFVQVDVGWLGATINTYPIIINQLTIEGSKSERHTEANADGVGPRGVPHASECANRRAHATMPAW